MKLPVLGTIDPLAVTALLFLVAVIGASITLFMWVSAQMRRQARRRDKK